jgi:hypothetical protein
MKKYDRYDCDGTQAIDISSVLHGRKIDVCEGWVGRILLIETQPA